ncbi:MAG TPA: DUF3368 domain-containing protein [Thermoanaerobaculia bacterium]
MTVVSDTSPLRYLLWLGHIELLPALFERVTIPGTVADELGHPNASFAVRTWIADPPPWLEIVARTRKAADGLSRLDPGERDAILLAEELRADLLIVDDRRGRDAARSRGIEIMGLIGVLDRAADRGLISVPDTVERLGETNFRVHPRLLKELLDRHKPK